MTLVFLVYLVALMALALWSRKETHTLQGFFLAGKKLPPSGDPALASHLVDGAMYMCSGTRAEDALPSTSRRLAGEAGAPGRPRGGRRAPE